VDLNYLYHRQQISHFMADNAACRCSRLAHLGLAKGYASRIAAMKAARPEAQPLVQLARVPAPVPAHSGLWPASPIPIGERP